MFNINFIQLISQLLTFFMRKPVQLSWMSAAVKGLTNLYDDYVAYSTEVIYDLHITYQVCYLEKVLNDKFNSGMTAYTCDPSTFIYSPVEGSIFIMDNPDLIQTQYLWTDAEIGVVTGVYPQYLWADSETGIVTGADPQYLWSDDEIARSRTFIVMIPLSLIDITTQPQQVAQIRAWLDKFRMAGCFYILQNY